jgi:D-alanine-D-alanine ligase
MPPHVLVLYNAPTLPVGHPDAAAEHEVTEIVASVVAALEPAGYRLTQLAVTDEPEPILLTLRRDRPDVVFNLFEGIADHGETEAYCAGLLEWLGIPYTGSTYRSMVLAWDKPRAKLLLQAAGIPTPAFQVIDRLPVPPCDLGWPVILKPGREDASVGIDQGSVVEDHDSYTARARLLLEKHGSPVLVEDYIDGRELNLALVECPELHPLPISEIRFQDDSLWPIVSYQAKWHAGSVEDRATVPQCPADVAPALAERLIALSHRAFVLFDCRDYARFDFRVDAAGEPYLLEVNPNPDFSPGAGLARALRAAGVSHTYFTRQLVEQALRRRPHTQQPV